MKNDQYNNIVIWPYYFVRCFSVYFCHVIFFFSFLTKDALGRVFYALFSKFYHTCSVQCGGLVSTILHWEVWVRAPCVVIWGEKIYSSSTSLHPRVWIGASKLLWKPKEYLRGGGGIDNLPWITMSFGRKSNNINLNHSTLYSDWHCSHVLSPHR